MNDDFDDRSSLLDAFAKSETPEPEFVTGLPVPTQHKPVTVIGAQRIAVARDESKIMQKLRVLAHAAGSDWYYRFPVKKRGGGTEYIEGPSIKLTSELSRLYMNCYVGYTSIEDLGEAWMIHALFQDYETGFVTQRPFQQRKSQRGMRTDAERALDIALQIGVSKGLRNVVVQALPAFCDFAFEEARHAMVEKVGKNLEYYRTKALATLQELNVAVPRAELVIGRPWKEWLAPDVSRVITMIRSVRDGMATPDETFPAPHPVEGSQSMEQFAEQEGAKNETEPTGSGGATDQGSDRSPPGGSTGSDPKK